MTAFPRVYRSFAEFEREELRKLDSLRTTVHDMLEEHFSEELGYGEESQQAGRRRGRRRR